MLHLSRAAGPAWLRWLAVLLGALVLLARSSPAWAVDGGPADEPARTPDVTPDLHGQWPIVGAGDPRDPLFVWPALRTDDPPFALAGFVERAQDPVAILDVAAGDKVPLVTTVWSAALSARYSLSKRAALALTLPVLSARYRVDNLDAFGLASASDTATAVGEIRVAFPIGLVVPDSSGWALTAIPIATWSPRSVLFLASGLPTVGGVATAGVRGERVCADLALGATVAKPLAAQSGASPLRGGATGQYGAALAARAGRALWLGAEVRGTGSSVGRLATSEILLSVRGDIGRSTAGGALGTGLVGGPGAAASRLWLGATWVPGSTDEDVPLLVFRVRDPLGVPVAGATLTSDERTLGTTDGAGELSVVRDSVRWGPGVRIEAPRLLSASVQRPTDLAAPIEVTLDWRPAVLDAKVTGATGEPVDVVLVARSLDRPDAAPIRGAPGEIALPPGRYRVTVEPVDGGLGSQIREVVVSTSGAPPLPLSVVTLPGQGGDGVLALSIVDPEGGPVVGARVLVDGLPVGVTGDGGFVGVGGLSSGAHEVVVQHESFTGAVLTVNVDPAGATVPVPLQRQPGTVRVIARTSDGQPVPDAVVRFVSLAAGDGAPVRLAPMALGANSDRIQVLSPGEWVAVVSSPAQGVQEREIVVPADRYELITVEILFRPAEDGVADLDVRLLDPSGAPVEGARIALDGEPVGATSTGGALVLRKLAPGPRRLSIDGTDLVASERQIVLTSGVQEWIETVRYVPGVVDVVVRGPEGPVDDAIVRFAGDQAGPRAAPVPPIGRLRAHVPPGQWTVVVSSAKYGVQERDLSIPADDGLLHTVDVVLAAFASGTADLEVAVTDPRGRPIGGAALFVDGVRVGATANSGIVRLDDLDVGPRTLRIEPSGPYAPLQRAVTLATGENRIGIGLGWAQNVVELTVRHGGRPVTDAVVRLLTEEERSKPHLVDGQGQIVLPVRRGLWAAYVTSAAIGVAEQQFEVTRPYTKVQVDMVPPPPERSDLAVAVVDPDGLPVGDALVLVDGVKLGDTEVSGVAVGRGLVPGAVNVVVRAPDYAAWGPRPVTLAPGGSERLKVVLDWLETEVEIVVRGPDGQPVDALVRWRGKRDIPEEGTGPDGRLATKLSPGEWRVYATAGALAADRAVEVELADEPAPIELDLAPTGAIMSGESVKIAEMVQFDFNEATLRPDSAPILAQVADLLLSQPDIVRVEVQGHSDTVGTIEVNMALSEARAEAVVQALVALGVPKETIFSRGYGPTVPLADNGTDAGRAQNRRVQFEVLERGAGKP